MVDIKKLNKEVTVESLLNYWGINRNNLVKTGDEFFCRNRIVKSFAPNDFLIDFEKNKWRHVGEPEMEGRAVELFSVVSYGNISEESLEKSVGYMAKAFVE